MHHILSDALPGMETRYRTNLINSLSGFKSLNLVGTHSSTKQTNLAVFSQVFHIGADPALLGLLVRPHTVPRHTLENIQETGDFTLNHIREEFMLQAHHTSARWEESEFSACHLTPWYSGHLSAPYVAEANVRIGLRLQETTPLACNNTVLLIGSVEEIWLPTGCLLADGFVDLQKAGSLTCSGLDSYHKVYKGMRLSYAKPHALPKVLNQNPL
ncbi:flavin reductase family protein [Cesiribacter andamanensis]|uniref:Flavin reductase like domain protein n=1 Tax=Cesiribacter andamanensis AMV16 TaxID=1279009 RepID=M7N5L4_9BACT|nr:flavin reductase [Cesiribacter andamanensis]EMR03918.1 Flavin reductase like domain protein [Cesiribacter andamanensis AMV16]